MSATHTEFKLTPNDTKDMFRDNPCIEDFKYWEIESSLKSGFVYCVGYKDHDFVKGELTLIAVKYADIKTYDPGHLKDTKWVANFTRDQLHKFGEVCHDIPYGSRNYFTKGGNVLFDDFPSQLAYLGEE